MTEEVPNETLLDLVAECSATGCGVDHVLYYLLTTLRDALLRNTPTCVGHQELVEKMLKALHSRQLELNLLCPDYNTFCMVMLAEEITKLLVDNSRVLDTGKESH